MKKRLLTSSKIMIRTTIVPIVILIFLAIIYVDYARFALTSDQMPYVTNQFTIAFYSNKEVPKDIARAANIESLLSISIVAIPVFALLFRVLIKRMNKLKNGDFVIIKERVVDHSVERRDFDSIFLGGTGKVTRFSRNSTRVDFLFLSSGKTVMLRSPFSKIKYPINSIHYFVYIEDGFFSAYYTYPCDKYQADELLDYMIIERHRK